MDALIIFARLPRAGEVKTRLGLEIGMENAATIYAEFAHHAFSLGKRMQSAGVSVYLFFDPLATEQEVQRWVGHRFKFLSQDGDDLGERMFNAFERTFRDGADRMLIIGTDVPELNDGVLANAFDNLLRNDVVIGPSTDGGYYLLGMRSPAKGLFQGIPWSTDSVLRNTLAKAGELGLSVWLLGQLADIDDETDYNAYIRRREKT